MIADRFWNGLPASLTWAPRNYMLSTWTEHVPFAFWIVEALRPRVLVELGTWNGMSYLAFCQAIAALGLETRATAVDTWQGDSQAGAPVSDALASLKAAHDAPYGGFSTLRQTDFDTARDEFADGSIDLLHIDGLHTYAAVKHDFETWLPKLSERGVVLFHDTQVRHGDFGVYRLWAELIERYPHFEFHHENGLGVLGVGADLPPAVRGLFDASADPAEAGRARAVFERLGSGVRAEQRYGDERAKIEYLKGNPMVKAALSVKRMYHKAAARS